jgi:hypothetical protein
MFSQCSIIWSIINDDCHQSASKFINLQNVHYRFCQLFIRMLFEERFERYKHFSKSKLAINEVCDNIHKDEMIERDSNVQSNENLNFNLEILKKIIFNLICSLSHHFFEKDSFENVNISSQIFHKVLEKRTFDRSKRQVYIQNVLQQSIVESLLSESKEWFFLSHEASLILINNWTNKKKKNQNIDWKLFFKSFCFSTRSLFLMMHSLFDRCLFMILLSIFSKIEWMNANSQFLQSTCDRSWVTFITSCQSAHTIFFRLRLSQTNFLCSRLRSVVSIFHEVSIVHQFSKSFSIFIVQITNCRFSNNIKLFEEDFVVSLNESVIKLFHALKEDFDALKEDFDCSDNIFISLSTEEVQSLSWDESSNDMINKLKIEDNNLFIEIKSWSILCNTRRKTTKWLVKRIWTIRNKNKKWNVISSKIIK